MRKKPTFNYYSSLLEESYSKKDNLLVIIIEQSNGGTTDDGTGQNTGRNADAVAPLYIKTAPVNTDFVQQTGSDLAVASWTYSASLQWGWLNQFLHAVSGAWTDIIYCKKSLGGSDILPGGLGNYPRTDLKSRLTVALTEANSRWGAGNYNVVYIVGIGETNAANAANADAWQAAMVEFIDDDLRVNYIDGAAVIIKKGVYQVIDFPYIVSNLWAAQDAYVALNTRTNYLVEGSVPAGWELQDSLDDFSHYNAAGAISLGNAVADKVLEIHGASRSDTAKPVLQTITVEDAAPTNIVLTYNKTLNTSVLPFWKDFTLNSNRKIITVAISGMTVTLTASENFYIGDTIELTYTKKGYYENAICDELGNEADALTSQVVTNNVNDAQPTYTAVYSSNFAAGVDSWGGLSGGGVAVEDAIGGLDDVLAFSAASDTSPLISRNGCFTGTSGHKHRIRLKMYIPSSLLVSGGTSNDWSIKMSDAVGNTVGQTNIYQYFRRNVLGDQWVDWEFTHTTVNTSTALRFEIAVTDLGQKIWIRDIVTHRIS